MPNRITLCFPLDPPGWPWLFRQTQKIKRLLLKLTICCFIFVLLGIEAESRHAYGAFLYKSYIVLQDRGRDILCDPYIVKKNDYVLKLFRQKGEISHEDFPEFLNIFKRINPQVRDINTIRPNQRIFIPLKQLKPGALPGQSSGIVTIPFVTIKKIDKILAKYGARYKVQRGDCVSKIVARRYGPYGTESYWEGIKLFSTFNSDITDLNLIYEGQTVYIPDPSIRNQAWYRPFLEGTVPSDLAADQKETDTDNRYIAQPGNTVQVPIQQQVEDLLPVSSSPFEQAAAVLNAKLLNKGVYFFPRDGKEDFKLDLSRYPMMEFNGKTTLFSSESEALSESEIDVINSHRNRLEVAQISSNPSTEQILDAVFPHDGSFSDGKWFSFTDQGVKVEIRAKWTLEKPAETGKPGSRLFILPIDYRDELTSPSIRHYLHQHNIIIKNFLRNPQASDQKIKTAKIDYSAQDIPVIVFSDCRDYVNDFLKAIGYDYTEQVSIMFPYAGIQVQALSNLIKTPDGKEVLVDFGDLYGDAVQSIEKTGFKIIQILEKNDLSSIMAKLMDAVGISYTMDPVFSAAKRKGLYHTRLAIPGFFVEKGGKLKILLASVPLHDRIIQFLQEQGIVIIRIESNG